MSLCLDSWAVLSWLDGDEPAYSRIVSVLGDRPALSWVNAVEVYYRIERQHGGAEAETAAWPRCAMSSTSRCPE